MISTIKIAGSELEVARNPVGRLTIRELGSRRPTLDLSHVPQVFPIGLPPEYVGLAGQISTDTDEPGSFQVSGPHGALDAREVNGAWLVPLPIEWIRGDTVEGVLSWRDRSGTVRTRPLKTIPGLMRKANAAGPRSITG
jgi:hypothetical protein